MSIALQAFGILCLKRAIPYSRSWKWKEILPFIEFPKFKWPHFWEGWFQISFLAKSTFKHPDVWKSYDVPFSRILKFLVLSLNSIQQSLLSQLLSLLAEVEHWAYPWMQISSKMRRNWSVCLLWLEWMWILQWLSMRVMTSCFAFHATSLLNSSVFMGRDSKLVVCDIFFRQTFQPERLKRRMRKSLDVQEQTNYQGSVLIKLLAFLWSLKLSFSIFQWNNTAWHDKRYTNTQSTTLPKNAPLFGVGGPSVSVLLILVNDSEQLWAHGKRNQKVSEEVGFLLGVGRAE